MILEITILASLIVLNGALAMSELAIVSARPARLKSRGTRAALQAVALAEDPGRFLSTVQIGITLVGVLSGAFSGATLGVRVGGFLTQAGLAEPLAQSLGVGVVVVVVTYLSLIVGELVPKQIALGNPEGVATKVAPPMALLAKIAAPLVWVLDRSGKLVLALLGQTREGREAVSDEEIQLMLTEAASAGVIEKGETAMIEGVMRAADRTAKGLMTPRTEVVFAEASDTLATLRRRFRDCGRSHLPLRDGGPDEIIGIVHARDVLLADPEGFDARAVMSAAPVIPEGLSAMEVVDRLRASSEHMLLVYDEYGQFEGLVTAMDILGAIAGGFDETAEDAPKITPREDGSFLVAGWMPVDEFAAEFKVTLPSDSDYETVAGLVLLYCSALPREGQVVRIGGWDVEVVDMDGRRIDKLLVRRADGMRPVS
jgi:putative hemolysin